MKNILVILALVLTSFSATAGITQGKEFIVFSYDACEGRLSAWNTDGTVSLRQVFCPENSSTVSYTRSSITVDEADTGFRYSGSTCEVDEEVNYNITPTNTGVWLFTVNCESWSINPPKTK